MHEILHEAQGDGEFKYHLKWRDRVDMRNHLAIFKKDGYEIES